MRTRKERKEKKAETLLGHVCLLLSSKTQPARTETGWFGFGWFLVYVELGLSNELWLDST